MSGDDVHIGKRKRWRVLQRMISWVVVAIACILALLIVMVARIVTQKRQGLAPTSFFTSPFCATRNFTVPYNFPNPLFQTPKKRVSITSQTPKTRRKTSAQRYDYFTEFLDFTYMKLWGPRLFGFRLFDLETLELLRRFFPRHVSDPGNNS